MRQTTLRGTTEYSFGYDPMGNIARLTLPSQSTHGFAYDDHDRDTLYQAPTAFGSNGADLKSYDKDGLLQWRVLPSGDTIRITRDAGGRISKVRDPFSEYSIAYLGRGERVSTLDRTAAFASHLQYTYDGSRILSETSTGASAGKVSWTYDADNHIRTTGLGATTLATYAYDRD